MSTSLDDILLWADGTWCYRYELPEMSHMSDDIEVIPYGTHQYNLLISGQ